ncbi:MAG TPA: hypothetical protein DCL60_02640, partial [Armatimonadetes bacterium]|nr:hypothetical protein [Armatimonadota bacterium]
MSRYVTGTLTPVCLKCEYLNNPLGLDIRRPRLSWEMYADRRGERQTAYQVLVATSLELLESDTGNLWDSGKVISGQSIHVEYAGAPLQSGIRCYWKARVWDVDGNSGPYSDANWWEMGLLEESEWQARWIGGTPQNIPEGKTSAPSPVFRQTFTLKQPVVSARAYICGLGYYELYLNGAKSGDHVLDPLATRYDRRALYVTHDITDMLVPGENAVGVMLGNGWYNAHTEVDWNFQTASWRALPKMMMQIHLVFADGSRCRIISDGGWRTSTGPIVFDALRNGETYDARLEKTGWLLPGYDDSSWDPALV